MASSKSLNPVKLPFIMDMNKLKRFSKKLIHKPNSAGHFVSTLLSYFLVLVALLAHDLPFTNAMESSAPVLTSRYFQYINTLDNLDFDYNLNTTHCLHLDSFSRQPDTENKASATSNNTQTKVNQLLIELDKLNSWEVLETLRKIVKTEDLDVIKGIVEDIPTLMVFTNPHIMRDRNILAVAIEHRSITIVEYLLTLFCKFETEETSKQIVYWNAIQLITENIHEIPPQDFSKKLQILQLALHHHPDLIMWDYSFRRSTLLHLATGYNFSNWENQLELIKMLIDNNADVNAKDYRGYTPLHSAIMANPSSPNLMKIIRILIDNQVNPDAVSTEYQCEEENSECVSRRALTFLQIAAESCELETFFQIVSYFEEINKTASLHVRDEQGHSLLYYILQNKKLEDVQELEKILQLFKSLNVDFNGVDNEGFSVLFYALNAPGNYNNSYINLLISFGADSNIKNSKTQETLLHMAAKADDLEAVKLYLELGADVNAQDSNGSTPLHQAFQSCRQNEYSYYRYCGDNLYDIVNLLLKHGANTNLKDKRGDSILRLVDSKISSDEEVKGKLIQLIKTKEMADTFKELNATMAARHLIGVIGFEDFEVIKAALKIVAENMELTEVWYGRYKSLLHIAVDFGNYEVVEYLLDSQGFSEKLNDTSFTNGLMAACLESMDAREELFDNKSKVMEILLRHKPELVNSKIGVLENTPLHIASMFRFRNGNKLELIQRLVENNANVNARNKEGNTPLHLVVLFKPLEEDFLDTIRLLVNHQADLNAVDKRGRTLLHIAGETVQRRKILPEQFHLLVEYLTQINKTESFRMVDTNGANVLHRAVLNFEVLNSTLKLLTEGGVDFNAVDYNGNSVLDYAKWGCRSTSLINTLDIKIHLNAYKNFLQIISTN